MKFNFTLSNKWINSLYIRYDINKLKKINDLYFYKNSNMLVCQHFFDFKIEKDLFSYFINDDEINKMKFSYFDNNKLICELKSWCNQNKIFFKLEDSWEAPVLNLNESFDLYIRKNKSSQIKNNYKMYLKTKDNYIIKQSNNKNIVDLWKDVLIIDNNSWKKKEKSDMKSLNREDLQYLPYMINNDENTSLFVLYDKKLTPLSYSLMFKNDKEWYQVKWGASDIGRNNYGGFIILFNHIEYLYKLDNKLILDFWGRRNNTYDKLKNDYKIRNHIIISKE